MHRPVSLAFLVANGVVSALLVVAPFAVPPGTAMHLDGLVNVRDHDWTNLPWPARVAYGFGDLICHQMESRSFSAHGNAFPVDARLLPMFLAGTPGLLLIRTWPDRPRIEAVLAGICPTSTARRRRSFMPLLLAAALLPTAVDGSLQLMTSYESTNMVRAFTGAWMGFAGAMWLGLRFDALAAPDLPAAGEREATA